MISFFVEGIPAPQGSKTAKCINGRAVMWETSKKVKDWRDTVAAQARIEMIAKGLETITNPVELHLTFYVPQPKSVSRKFPSVKPDLDKLIRSTCDALTKSTIYKDDALVVMLFSSKQYAHNKSGCLIRISAIDV
jgi:Holliday junction resolvase RusA-like endonuclease